MPKFNYLSMQSVDSVVNFLPLHVSAANLFVYCCSLYCSPNKKIALSNACDISKPVRAKLMTLSIRND